MTGLIEATTQFWGDPLDISPDTLAMCTRKWELSEQDRYCFECPLPECDQQDERCPFSYSQSQRRRNQIAKVIRRARQGWERAVDEAAAQIWAEREAPCAT